jgi:hypothetical protein
MKTISLSQKRIRTIISFYLNKAETVNNLECWMEAYTEFSVIDRLLGKEAKLFPELTNAWSRATDMMLFHNDAKLS